MRRMTGFCLLLMLIALFHGTGVAQYTGVAPTSAPGLNIRHPLTTDQAILYPPQRELTLMPSDLITVSVYGIIPTYTDMERIAQDGTVRLPLAGVVKVAGYTLKDAEARISEIFEQQEIFHDAQVTITLGEAPNHVATFVGATRKNIPVYGQMPLLTVLSEAGGLPETASTVIQIDRPGLTEPIYLDLGNDPSTSTNANIPIFAGDVITSGQVGFYYVVGAVANPGMKPLGGSRPTTALQALATVGGVTYGAKYNDVQLVRTVGETRTVIPLRLKDIKDGKQPDVVLQAEDIVLVPSSAWRAALKFNNATAVMSMAVALVALLR